MINFLFILYISYTLFSYTLYLILVFRYAVDRLYAWT